MTYYAQGGQNIPAQGTPEPPPMPAVQRGILAAQEEYRKNQLQGFEDQLGRLKRATVNRDTNSAGRQHYDLVHAETRAYAERVATITGQKQLVPKHLPPPNVAVEFETVDVPPYDLGLYEERKDQRNLPKEMLPDFSNPESKQTQDWLTAQGSAPLNETSGQSPADIGKAKRKRAGEPS